MYTLHCIWIARATNDYRKKWPCYYRHSHGFFPTEILNLKIKLLTPSINSLNLQFVGIYFFLPFGHTANCNYYKEQNGSLWRSPSVNDLIFQLKQENLHITGIHIEKVHSSPLFRSWSVIPNTWIKLKNRLWFETTIHFDKSRVTVHDFQYGGHFVTE